MKRIVILFFIACLFAISCKSSSSTTSSKESHLTEKWIVGNKKVTCGEEKEKMCYQVKRSGSDDYEALDLEIIGFTYEEGYKYQIEVEKIESKKNGTSYYIVSELFKVPYTK